MSAAAGEPELSLALARFQSTVRHYSTLGAESASCDDLETWLNLLAEMGEAMRDIHLAGAAVSRHLDRASAQSRMGALLEHRRGEPVTNYELAGVALTLEWARRVRELQKQEGWAIEAGPSAGLAVGTYRLNLSDRDVVRARAWKLRHDIRRGPGSGGAKCLEYLKALFPSAATKEDLTYVSQIQSWPRRVRELAQDGWPIVSSADDPTLPAGSYRLESLSQGPARPRQAIKQRHQILERDRWTCQDCGSSPRTEPLVRLQIHHHIQVQHGGGNEDENLVTLCAPCHAGRHSLDESQVADELLNPAANPEARAIPGA